VTGPGAEIRWDPELTSQVDYEAELAVIIGRRARNVAVSDALDHVLGYTCLNDVSARDLQFGDGQWTRGKSLDTFCPMGPALVTADEVGDPGDLAIRCTVNGEPVQDARTSAMYFGVAEIISFCSTSFTLEPGDVIATGTPGGVGVFRDPPRFLADGDRIVVEIERIGRLENVCRHAPAGARAATRDAAGATA
jgi:2-keto-4-pentenoate hydratase/2-oxohepta-3-ene-1,7-dioic acid hydratase in catechol pathway